MQGMTELLAFCRRRRVTRGLDCRCDTSRTSRIRSGYQKEFDYLVRTCIASAAHLGSRSRWIDMGSPVWMYPDLTCRRRRYSHQKNWNKSCGVSRRRRVRAGADLYGECRELTLERFGVSGRSVARALADMYGEKGRVTVRRVSVSWYCPKQGPSDK